MGSILPRNRPRKVLGVGVLRRYYAELRQEECSPGELLHSPGLASGEAGIRTLGTFSRTHAFQACAFNHSATSPVGSNRQAPAARATAAPPGPCGASNLRGFAALEKRDRCHGGMPPRTRPPAVAASALRRLTRSRFSRCRGRRSRMCRSRFPRSTCSSAPARYRASRRCEARSW